MYPVTASLAAPAIGGRVRRAQLLGRRRRRHAEVGQARQHQLHGLRIRRLVHAVERVAPAACQQARDELVRQDHQLLHEHVRVRLGLAPGALHPALAVEGEDHLSALDPQRATGEAPVTQRGGEPLGPLQRLGQLGVGALAAAQDRLGARVGQPLAAADHRAVELRLPVRQPTLQRHLDGEAEAVGVRPQRAELLRELRRQHRRDETWHVDGERPLLRAAVERRAGRHEIRDVGDVHVGAVLGDRERVVEVLGGLRVDGEGELIAQVDAAFGADRRRIVGLEAAELALLHQQPLEDDFDPGGRPEHALDPRPTTAFVHHGEIAWLHLPRPLAIEHDRSTRREIRLADEELAPLGDLDD